MTKENSVNLPIEKSYGGTPPQLIAIMGPLSGHTFDLDEPVVSIGRLASNTICLEDQFVSRHHCVITLEDDEYRLDDLNSANGTYLNGERVTAGSLEDGSLIEIGVSRFIFRFSEGRRYASFNQASMSSDYHLPVADSGRLRLNEIRPS